jgi:hypothetical protein
MLVVAGSCEHGAPNAVASTRVAGDGAVKGWARAKRRQYRTPKNASAENSPLGLVSVALAPTKVPTLRRR